MRKFIEFIKKNYIYINIAFLLFSICIILFPFILSALNKIIPYSNKCWYLVLTGKQCPLCGGTRYVQGLYKNVFNIKYYFHPFGIMMLFVFFEFIYRMYNIVTRKKEKSDIFIKIDIIIHVVAIILFFLYMVGYFIVQI